MLAARALFAFRAGERADGPPIEPSERAMVGALLEAEWRAADIATAENFIEWVKAWVKSKRGRRGAGRGSSR
jgi:hypothetical protein